MPTAAHAAPPLLAALLLAAPLAAQQPARPAPPRCDTPDHRAFDFWAGRWEVTDSAGTKVLGTNAITIEEGGCVLHERWTGAGGATGQSLNFFDRDAKRWEQLWVDNTGAPLRLAGAPSGGAMVLEGSAPGPGGAPARQRITWTPLPDGRVRQCWETSRDGASWTTAFDGWYRRAGAQSPPSSGR